MSFKELYVAIWKVNVAEIHNLQLFEKKARINRAMIKAASYLKAAGARMNAKNPVYLFAAPEYYWIKPAYKLYDKAEKDDIYQWLQQVSSNLNGLIMFPGTVNWQVLKAPVNTEEEPKQKTKTKAFSGYNSAPVYLDGQRLLDYDKKFNDGEVDKQANGMAQFISGGRGGIHTKQDFRAKGLHFGLDICGDLNKGQLMLTLGDEKVDVMVVISATVAHHFGNSKIDTIAVRDGGAFVQCDSSKPEEAEFRNGVWALSRGKGMHGRDEDVEVFRLKDLDDVGRIIGVPKGTSTGNGPTVNILALGGFGSAKSVTATGAVRNNYGDLRKFSMTLPGSGRSQMALFEKSDSGGFNVTLSRFLSKSKVTEIKADRLDLAGTKFSGTGNVTKISRLLPDPDMERMTCYCLPIPPAL